ncbi:TIGR02391 family protein [Conexibacter stalactiti]|uniref:TIGR02391 family protein n=1 Tax=Conexibacter stalactiti TaxID=1940611 RepID=A0ABU4HV50_9ACTN|nr:TIGR02391 family protein [Conexibacter stalactiti]MDW5595939.1 TIGR02391 family protein [Conexibacter stalactiti]MEC5036581.1 TIGR02391 family protein [Conexibacter stalactiti]
MANEAMLDASVLRGIAEVLGATETGFSNSEIDRVLAEAGILDPTPRSNGLTYTIISKRDRLERALVMQQERDGRANRVLLFLKVALRPARFHSAEDRFEMLRAEVNVPLAFAGLAVTEDGRIARIRRAETLSDARRRALRLKAVLTERATHRRLLAACVQEIEDENYFHAVLEGAKSLATEIRARTGAISDGVRLVDEVFESGRRGFPLLALSAMQTETERSRQRGLADGLRSVFGSLRNPVAHEPRVQSRLSELDALEAFGWMSSLHRRIDECHRVSASAGSA